MPPKKGSKGKKNAGAEAAEAVSELAGPQAASEEPKKAVVGEVSAEEAAAELPAAKRLKGADGDAAATEVAPETVMMAVPVEVAAAILYGGANGGEVTAVLKIPASAVGHVIGKQGQTIKCVI